MHGIRITPILKMNGVQQLVFKGLEYYITKYRTSRLSQNFKLLYYYPSTQTIHQFELGKQLQPYFKNNKTHTISPKQQQLLEKINYIQAEKLNLIPVFQVYKQQNGHLSIPITFVVPIGNPKWPIEYWGYALGKQTSQLRSLYSIDKLSDDYIQELNELGMIWNVYSDKWNSQTLPALKYYHKLNGDINVSQSFITPASWPKPYNQVKLGLVINRLRRKSDKLSEEMKSQLNELGMVWHAYNNRFESIILPALRHYYKLYGHLRVMPQYVVPDDSEWPEELWNIKLGRAYYKMRIGEHYKNNIAEHMEELTEYGFQFQFEEWTLNSRKLILFPVLQYYYQLFGDSNVPKRYKTPADWPTEYRCINLGNFVGRLRKFKNQLSTEVLEALMELDFSFHPTKDDWNDIKLPALQMYYSLYGDLNIPTKFIVPEEKRWPKSFHKIKLGALMSSLRGRSLSPEKVEQLNALDMVWDYPEHEFLHTLLPALQQYHKLYGNLNIPSAYTIPPNTDWPTQFWGIHLGYRYHCMKYKKHYKLYAETHSKELEAIGYM